MNSLSYKIQHEGLGELPSPFNVTKVSGKGLQPYQLSELFFTFPLFGQGWK